MNTKNFTYSLIAISLIWGFIYILGIWWVLKLADDILWKINWTFIIIMLVNLIALLAIKNLEILNNSKPKN